MPKTDKVFAFCLHASTGFLSFENAFRLFGEPADFADRTRSTARPLKSGADFLKGFRDYKGPPEPAGKSPTKNSWWFIIY